MCKKLCFFLSIFCNLFYLIHCCSTHGKAVLCAVQSTREWRHRLRFVRHASQSVEPQNRKLRYRAAGTHGHRKTTLPNWWLHKHIYRYLLVDIYVISDIFGRVEQRRFSVSDVLQRHTAASVRASFHSHPSQGRSPCLSVKNLRPFWRARYVCCRLAKDRPEAEVAACCGRVTTNTSSFPASTSTKQSP